MQKKKFIFDLAILLILNLLIKPFWILGIEPQVQLKVGDISYGEFAALFNFSLMMNILLDFGLTNFINKTRMAKGKLFLRIKRLNYQSQLSLNVCVLLSTMANPIIAVRA